MRAPGFPGTDRNGWLRSIIAAAVLAVTGLIAAVVGGLQVDALAGWRDGQITWLTILAGVFLSASLLWRRIGVWSRRGFLLRGAAAGVLTAILSYPATLVLAKLGQLVAVGPRGFLERLVGALELAGLLLVGTGFAATILMGLVGMLLALLLRPAPNGRSRADNRRGHALASISLLLVLALGGAFAVLSAMPVDMNGLDVAPPPTPGLDHDGAMAAFSEIAAEEAGLELDQRCLSSLLTHGSKVAVAVIFLHGFTNCPYQADLLGKQLYELGYNVYVPRLPLHGSSDRMTDKHRETTVEDLVGERTRPSTLHGGSVIRW